MWHLTRHLSFSALDLKELKCDSQKKKKSLLTFSHRSVCVNDRNSCRGIRIIIYKRVDKSDSVNPQSEPQKKRRSQQCVVTSKAFYVLFFHKKFVTFADLFDLIIICWDLSWIIIARFNNFGHLLRHLQRAGESDKLNLATGNSIYELGNLLMIWEIVSSHP